ncbi:Uu.00g104100.m01.CDS01 [Anthostomella pinea]|uniref:Uu.00g104100.m01.CDS01 n=1 Tax=Anthostomella pinea TaxID=933095 RepID=A0AAI8VDQ6_9PEZI|nr:Uu.00g104100.m01.CDS01 [Anthostomella pinea]
MDMDEDDQRIDKNSGEPSPHGPSSRSHDPSRTATTSTTSHDNPQDPDNILAPAPTRRRGPPKGRSSKSTTTALTPSPSTITTATAPTTASTSSHPPPVRRPSTDSTESMDPTGYGGHGQSSSSSSMAPSTRSNMPMRPVPNSAGESNLPVKLTPITGRVSRAKKGVPVHTCETFTRAEHLRRHALSHKTPGYQCTFPGCDKAFHRADLLTRHVQRHEQDDKSSKGTSGDMSRRTSEVSFEEGSSSRMGGYMQHPSMGGGSGSRGPMSAPSDMSPGSAYPGNTPSYQPMSNQGSSSGQTPMSPPQHTGRRDSHRSTSAGPSQGHHYVLSSPQQIPFISNQPPSMEGSPLAGTTFGLEYQQPRTLSPYPMYMGPQGLVPDLPSLTIPDDNVPGLLAAHEASPWASSTPDSNFSTPSDPGQRRNMPRSYGSPSGDWHDPQMYQAGTSSSGMDPIATTSAPYFVNPFASSTEQSYDPMLLANYGEHTIFDPHSHPYSTVRSPTPPTVTLSAQSAENLVTLAAPSIPAAAGILGRQKDSAGLGLYTNAAFLTAVTLSRPVLNAIPEYLELYWKRFDTLFPLVHRRSFETAADEILRCAMAAMGSQFLQGKEDRMRGNILHEYAWQEVQRFTTWNVSVMQAILLCEFYSRFRGRKVANNRSAPFQSLYARVADFSNPDHDYAATADARAEQHWTAWSEWIDAESRRRLLAACFALDVHASVYHENHFNLQFSTPTPPIPLTRPSVDLWAARSPEEWAALLASADPMEPATLPEENLTPDRIATAPPLDRGVFLASETLRLPRRASASQLDLSVPVDLSSPAAERISTLFPGHPVAATTLALHHTPLHDLLAISGDSWIFSIKMTDPTRFQQCQRRLLQWSNSAHAGAAAGFAARALLAFLDTTTSTISLPTNNANDTITTTTTTQLQPVMNTRSKQRERKREAAAAKKQQQDRDWNMDIISDYWALYTCALVIWALCHPSARGRSSSGSTSATTSSSGNATANAAREKADERDARGWLALVADLQRPDEVLGVRGRREAAGVVGMVRRRLEDEVAGGKGRLLVDAVGVLRKLEEGVGRRWF